jgi:hypothetical protein
MTNEEQSQRIQELWAVLRHNVLCKDFVKIIQKNKLGNE